MSDTAQLRKEIIDGIAAMDPDTAAHLESLSEDAFQTLLRIALHRSDPQRYPHPGYAAEHGHESRGS
jgi:hypothetical protein